MVSSRILGAAAKTTPVANPKMILPTIITGKYGTIDKIHPTITNTLAIIIGILLPFPIRDPPITDPNPIPRIPEDASIVFGEVIAF